MKYKTRLERLTQGLNRGNNLIKIFSKYKKNLENKNILDVGCGHGSLTIDFSKKFKEVYSIDGGEKEIQITKKRTSKMKNVIVKLDNALEIKSTSKKFDIIHLSGVFEWLRLGNEKKTANYCQKKFLHNIKKNMKNNSILYSGTENKMFPYFWIRDPHNENWPFLVLLPELISDFVFKIFKKRKYHAKIYSYWTLKKMFCKEFKKVEFFIPIPHYQYVYEFANIHNKSEIILKCNLVLTRKDLDFRMKISTLIIKYSAKIGIVKLLSPGFITIAQK